jgi:hypothetical protein
MNSIVSVYAAEWLALAVYYIHADIILIRKEGAILRDEIKEHVQNWRPESIHRRARIASCSPSTMTTAGLISSQALFLTVH